MGIEKLLRLVFLLEAILATQVSHAGEIFIDSIPEKSVRPHLLQFSHKTDEQYCAGKLLLTPFLVPGYSPDIQFALTAGCIFSFKTTPGDSLLPRSTTPVSITYSSSGAFVANASCVTFWDHDRFRLNSQIQYRAVRDVYYGVGYFNAIHTSYPDSIDYRRSYFIMLVRPLWRIWKSLFAGVSLDYNQNILWDINPHMTYDPNYREFGQKIINAGVGGTINYDSRDLPQNAYRGFYTSATYTFYGKMAGANTRFRALDVDSRLYIPLGSVKIRTLALNWRTRYEFGPAPFTYMASFGSPFDLRGYRYGQFRDQFFNYGIAEYRQKLYTGVDKPTRFGFVIWGGVGAIGDGVANSLFRYALPNVGIGLRFEIQPRLNVRFDLGYAPSHTGVYFNFLEAY